jgi:hypothetical protein
MPCGRGFEWVREKGVFIKRLITNENISIGSVEWIDFMNNDKRFIDNKGARQYIQSGWGGKEVVIGSYPVDGFVEVDDVIYTLEFDGCFWVRPFLF